MDFYSKCHKSVVLIFEQFFYENQDLNFSIFMSLKQVNDAVINK